MIEEFLDPFRVAMIQATASAPRIIHINDTTQRQTVVEIVEARMQPFVTKVSTYHFGQLIAEFTPTAV